jgi:hypothetical protein
MRKIVLALSAVAAAVLAVSVGTRTEAAPLGNPGALSGALEDVSVLDSVHCRPGRRHHRPTNWRRADGCARRGYRSDVIVVPGRTRYIWRDGVRVRVGSGDRWRGGDRVRTRSNVNVDVRGGDGRRDGARSGDGRRGGAAQTGGSGRQGTSGSGRGGQGGAGQGGTGGTGAGGQQGGGASQPAGQGGPSGGAAQPK